MNGELIERGNILYQNDDLISELRGREKESEIQSVSIDDPIPNGWKVKKRFVGVQQIIKEKSKDHIFEDKLWRLFYLSGMNMMSTKPLHLYSYDKKDVREIDVIAADDDFVFLIECTSKKSYGKKEDLKGKLDITNSKFKSVNLSVKELFPDRHIIRIFASEDIDWTERQIAVAKAHGFTLLNEIEIAYLFDLVNIAGTGAKYQMYGRILRGKEVSKLSFKLPALQSKMGGKTFYSFNIEPEKLLKIAFVNKRENSEFEDLALSYQRVIKKRKIDQIRNYLNKGGFFPNSIIVNFEKPINVITQLGNPTQKANWKKATRSKPVELKTPGYFGCAWIIDGQHRLYGFSESEKKNKETVSVVAFNEIDDTSTFEAQMFMDINENQTAISADLKWDLYEELYVNSEDEAENNLYNISCIAKKLNESGPFKNQIAIPKSASKGHISLNYICSAINRANIIGKQGPLRKDKKEETIKYATDRINIFFEIFKKSLSEQWNSKDGHFINAKPGMYIFFPLLRDFLGKLFSRAVYDNKKKFEEELTDVLVPSLFHFIDTMDQEIITNFKKASSFSILPECQEILIKKVQKFRPYDSDLLKRIKKGREVKLIKKGKSGLKDLLIKNDSENKTFEAKGSIALNINQYIKNNGKVEQIKDEKIIDEILKTVSSFLNTDGGILAVGVLENNKYLELLKNTELFDFNEYTEIWSVIGSDKEIELHKGGWDDLKQYIENKISGLIEPEPLELVTIEKIYFSNDVHPIMIQVGQSDRYHYFRKKFYFRTNTGKENLEGQKLEHYLSRNPR